MIGYSYIHSAVDDHSRPAYSEVLPDKRQRTAIALWQRARSSPPTASPSNAF